MQATQQPSAFAQIIDILRTKTDEELEELYTQLSERETIEQNRILAEDYRESYTSPKHTKKNNLDEIFGILKDENITLESIRKEAWQRTK